MDNKAIELIRPIVIYKTLRGRYRAFLRVQSIEYDRDNNGHVLEVLRLTDGSKKVLRADYNLRLIPERERRRRSPLNKGVAPTTQ